MTKTVVIMNLAIVVATVIAFIYFTTKAKLKESKAARLKQRRKLHNRFAVYYNNVIVRGAFRRIVEMYASLSCYDADTVKEESVKLFEKNFVIAVIIPVVGMIVMRDIVVCILLAFIGYVYYQSTIEKENDKIYVKLMEEFSMVISSVREKYMETNSIPLSILYAEKSPLLEAPMNSVYRILTDTDGSERLAKFQHSYPVPIIKTFANTCYIVNENGAVINDKGADSFAEDMTVLRQECDAEIRRLTRQKIAFNSLQMLSLAGLIVMPAFELYLLQQIPGTASLLKGYYGLAIHVAVLLSTAFSYTYIARSCRPSVVNQIDKLQFIDELSRKKKVREFVKDIIPKSFKTRKKMKMRIDGALSAMDMQYIYTAKPIFAAICFVAAFIVLIFGTITIRDSFYHNYHSLSFIPQNMTETQLNQIKRMDDEFMETSQADYDKLEDADLEKLVKSRVTGISDSDATEQQKRLRVKYKNYHGAHYYWWWWLVAYGAAVAGWFIPELSLASRKKMVQYEATNDVSQLQTMMIVLSETKMDAYKAIYWLERQSSIHKHTLRKCHYSYIANPEKAMDVLEEASPINDFKRLVRKLKSAIYTLSLHDAFSDMALDKAQTLTITEMKRGEELEQRKNSAKLIAVLPVGLALIGTFIGPVLILGVTEMVSTLNNLQGFGK